MRKFLHGQRRITLSFVLLTIVFFAVVATMGWQINKTRQLARENRVRAIEGQQAHDALCATRHNLQERIAATTDFIAKGGRIPGVPSSLLVAGLARDKTTLEALSPLRCDPTKETR